MITSFRDESGWMVGLLSTFRLEHKGEVTLEFRGRKQDRLVAYLALHRNQDVSREDVAMMFWPEKPVTKARNRLSELLVYVRRDLSEHRAPEDLILANRYTLRLNPAVGTDIERFEQLHARATTEPDQDLRNELLNQAASVYGTGLLPALRADWTRPHSQRLSGMFHEVTRLLDESQSASHNLVQSPKHAPAFSRDPLPNRVPAISPSEQQPPRDILFASTEPPASSLGMRVSPRRSPGGLRKRLAHRYLTLAEEAEPYLWGAESEAWFERLDTTHRTMSAMLEWVLEDEDDAAAIRFVGALWKFWLNRGHVDQGRRFLEQALLLRPRGETALDAKALTGAGALAIAAGDPEFARRKLHRAERIWRDIGDAAGLARTLTNLAVLAHTSADYTEARRLYDESLDLIRRAERPDVLAAILEDVALMEIAVDEVDRAAGLLRERLALGHRSGDRAVVGWTLVHLGSVEQLRGKAGAAREFTEQALEIFEDIPDLQGLALCLRLLGYALYKDGELEDARIAYNQSLGCARAAGDLRETGESLRYLASLSEEEGQIGQAEAQYRQAHAILEDVGDMRAAAQAQRALEALLKSPRGMEKGGRRPAEDASLPSDVAEITQTQDPHQDPQPQPR